VCASSSSSVIITILKLQWKEVQVIHQYSFKDRLCAIYSPELCLDGLNLPLSLGYHHEQWIIFYLKNEFIFIYTFSFISSIHLFICSSMSTMTLLANIAQISLYNHTWSLTHTHTERERERERERELFLQLERNRTWNWVDSKISGRQINIIIAVNCYLILMKVGYSLPVNTVQMNSEEIKISQQPADFISLFTSYH